MIKAQKKIKAYEVIEQPVSDNAGDIIEQDSNNQHTPANKGDRMNNMDVTALMNRLEDARKNRESKLIFEKKIIEAPEVFSNNNETVINNSFAKHNDVKLTSERFMAITSLVGIGLIVAILLALSLLSNNAFIWLGHDNPADLSPTASSIEHTLNTEPYVEPIHTTNQINEDLLLNIISKR